MRYKSNMYSHTVQRMFATNFEKCFDPARGEMRDADGRTITTDGHLSHDVRTGMDGANVARLRIYSYGKCIAQWWRVPMGQGHRIFGWNSPPNSSVTTNRHISDLSRADTFNDGVRVTCLLRETRIFDEVGQLPDIEELQVMYDAALTHAGPTFIPAIRSSRGVEVMFESNDLGCVMAEVWRADEPSIRKLVEVPAMHYSSLLRGLHIFELGLTHHKKPHLCIWQSPTRGYFVNAREKIVGYWAVPETKEA